MIANFIRAVWLGALLSLFLVPTTNALESAATAASAVRQGEGDDSLAAILADAREEKAGIIRRYCLLRERPGTVIHDDPYARLETNRELLREFAAAGALVDEARTYARTALGNRRYDEGFFRELMEKTLSSPDLRKEWATETAHLILEASEEGTSLRKLRLDVLEKLQHEARRGRVQPGTRMAWGMLRVGLGDPESRIYPESISFTADRASMSIVHRGVAMRLDMTEDDFEKRIRAEVDGFTFTAGWAVLFQKPLGWMAAVAMEMRAAGVDPAVHPAWEVLEGPEGVIALAPAAGGFRSVFYRGSIHDVAILPPPADDGRMVDAFRQAAKRLHEGVMADAAIARPLRQALNPVLMGTYLPVDPRDYFDAAFCRRLIEADYLEKHIVPFPAERARELADYRQALGRMEAGYDEFIMELGNGRRLFATVAPEFEIGARDPETGESVQRYTWRIESPEDTTFFSPMPGRTLHAFSLAERYPGRHRLRPKGVPSRTEVRHALLGAVLTYDDGAEKAAGSARNWREAVVQDTRGRLDSSAGPLGWNFPPYVLQRDDQGDPVLVATLNGVVRSPDLSGLGDARARRQAADAWLDHAARVLATPGELNLIFTQFFRYCSDSPLPEMPNLIGSHYGLSDTHQTVYESLDRRWVGRLIGDCDDLAEFFQVLTARQGRLSHVMQLPAHAAAGYCQELSDGSWEFVVLQTGPVLRFVAASAEAAVEKAYRHFDENSGRSRFTSAAVPILLRFADEDTRTPFVLSSRIYWDRDYAEAMIRVQGHWHLHTFSAAIEEMEEMLRNDREVGSIKELASLYNRVGRYEESAELRREELETVRGDAQATLSTLLDIAQMHIQDKNKPLALAALTEMGQVMQAMLRDRNDSAFVRAQPFRAYWAMLLARLGEPEKAWRLVRKDVEAASRRGAPISETVLRTLVTMFDRMPAGRDDGADSRSGAVRRAVGREIEKALAEGFFKADDSYNYVLRRYFVLGRYAVALEGRPAGLARLLADGPYPEGAKDHSRRDEGVEDEDWNWLRITPQLFMAYGLEMIDRDDYPEFYDPDLARPVLRAVVRAVERGSGLGSDVVGGEDLIRSELILAFMDGDLDAYRRVMTGVRARNYASLYDDAALAFGEYCAFIPPEDFPAWLDEFHRFFPGRQNYFKAAYRALDKEHFDHAVMLAEATARFFPDDPLLVRERDYLVREIPRLRERRAGLSSAAGAPLPEAVAAEESGR